MGWHVVNLRAEVGGVWMWVEDGLARSEPACIRVWWMDVGGGWVGT